MIHPHDTDRILGVLGDAIAKLREGFEDYQWNAPLDVANDLALLHGAVSAEADECDLEQAADGYALEQVPHSPWVGDHVRREEVRKLYLEEHGGGYHLPRCGLPKDIDVKVSEAGRRRFLHLVHHEEILDEVLRGEHGEGD